MTVIVSVPLTLRSSSFRRSDMVSCSSVSFHGFTMQTSSQVRSSDADSTFPAHLQKMCKQLGMQEKTSCSTPEAGSLHIVYEDELQDFNRQDREHPASEVDSIRNAFRGPCIVVCETRRSALQSQALALNYGGAVGSVQFLWHPIGPAKLAAAIASTSESGQSLRGREHPSLATIGKSAASSRFTTSAEALGMIVSAEEPEVTLKPALSPCQWGNSPSPAEVDRTLIKVPSGGVSPEESTLCLLLVEDNVWCPTCSLVVDRLTRIRISIFVFWKSLQEEQGTITTKQEIISRP